jgi:type VI protein secretion system component Hcp
MIAGGATVDYFLKIDGIDGESTDDKHKGEIQLESYSLAKPITPTKR